MKKYERIILNESILMILLEQIKENDKYKLIQIIKDDIGNKLEYYAILEREVLEEVEETKTKNSMLDQIFGAEGKNDILSFNK